MESTARKAKSLVLEHGLWARLQAQVSLLLRAYLSIDRTVGFRDPLRRAQKQLNGKHSPKKVGKAEDENTENEKRGDRNEKTRGKKRRREKTTKPEKQ